MTLSTMLIRRGGSLHYAATQHADGQFSAFEEAEHPTPSGNPRLVLTMSDNRKWPTADEAIAELKKALVPYDAAFDARSETPDADAE